ncbi:hypothetical protein LXL04_023443 [Taraxacum kok-saghyz]
MVVSAVADKEEEPPSPATQQPSHRVSSPTPCYFIYPSVSLPRFFSLPSISKPGSLVVSSGRIAKRVPMQVRRSRPRPQSRCVLLPISWDRRRRS